MKKISLIFLILIIINSLSFANNEDSIENQLNEEKFDTASYWTTKRKQNENRKAFKAELVSKHVAVQKYNLGDNINLAGLRVNVWYDDMTIEEIDFLDERIKVEGFNSEEPGKSAVTVYFEEGSFKEYLYYFNANVIEQPVKRSSPSKNNTKRAGNILTAYMYREPTKTIYLSGDEIDLSGAAFYIKRENRAYDYVEYNENDFSIVNIEYNKFIPGCQEVEAVLTYEGFQFSSCFNVINKLNMSDKIVTKLALINYPQIRNVEDINWTNALFQIEYDDNSSDFIEFNKNKMEFDLSKNTDEVFYRLDVYYYEDITNKYNTSVRIEAEPIIANIDFSSYEEASLNYHFYTDRSIVNQELYDLDEFPSKYNLKNIINSQTKDQGSWGLCWDFSSTKSLETNFYLKYGIEYDLSEKYADYLTSNIFYGDREETLGGSESDYSNQMQITGVPTEETVPYVQVDPSEYADLENVEKAVQPLSTAIFLKPTIYDNYIKEQKMIKSHIMNYGAVITDVSWPNNETHDYFYHTSSMSDGELHAISLIGWDDSVSKERFTKTYNGITYTPEHDGAWIAQNSWGNDFGFDDGLFYVSYDLPNAFFGFLDSIPYENKNIYAHYRKLTTDCVEVFEGANVFYLYVEYEKSNNPEYLTNLIVDRYMPAGKYYLLKDYDSIANADFSKLIHLGDHYIDDSAIHLLDANIVLDNPIEISSNKFMIVVKLEGDHCSNFNNKISYMPDDEDIHTYYSFNKLSHNAYLFVGDVPVFAFTINEDEYNNRINNEVDRVEIVSLPKETDFNIGQEIDLTSGDIKVYYKNGTEEIKSMTDEDVYWYGYTDYDKTFGTKELRVFYGDKFDTFDIEILDDISRIEMNELPSKMYYGIYEEPLEIENGSIKVYFGETTSRIIPLTSPEISLTPDHVDYAIPGKQEINVSYKGFTTSFEIEVANKVFVDAELETKEKELRLNENISLSDFDVNVLLTYMESGEIMNETVSLNNEDFEISSIHYSEEISGDEMLQDTVIYSSELTSGDVPDKFDMIGYYDIFVFYKEYEKALALPLRVHVTVIGHDYELNEGVEPTCERIGNILFYTCRECGKIFDSEYNEITIDDTEIPALGHSWDEGEITKEPNCTESGEKTYTCQRDSTHTRKEDVSPTGHTSGDVEIESGDSPTCTEQGTYYEVIKCTICGKELSRVEKHTEALGHSFGDWVVIKEPTTTEVGTRERVCTRCGAKEQEEIPMLEEQVMHGDLDGDKTISIIDVRLLLQGFINHSSNEQWSEDDLEMMDIDGNNNIDIIDVRLLLQMFINT